MGHHLSALTGPEVLNLGCGGTSDEDPAILHHDITAHSPGVRLTGNLEGLDSGTFVAQDPLSKRFFFCHREDSAPRVLFKEVNARDVLEHLPPNRIHAIIEFCWGALEDGGHLHVQVPQFGSVNAVIDPTHYRGFHLRSFDFFDPTTSIGKKSAFYGLRPWKLLRAEVVPRSDVNLLFVLKKICPVTTKNPNTAKKLDSP